VCIAWLVKGYATQFVLEDLNERDDDKKEEVSVP